MSGFWKAAGFSVAAAAVCAAAVFASGTTGTTKEQPDRYLWLEDVTGVRALAWVKAQDARTDAVLKADPHYAQFGATALAVLQSPTRLPSPSFQAGEVYNTWQDAQHVRGILRRTTLDDYRTAEPHWQTVLDYDALARDEHQNWVAHGLTCVYPGNGLCLVGLSVGGEDASTEREFDLKTGRFVTGGFVLPHSKQSVDWVDKDTLILARDWGQGTMTTSGYPFVVKLLKRGQPLTEAKEIFRGAASDVGVSPETLDDAQGDHAVIIERNITFFSHATLLVTPHGAVPLSIPAKSDINGLLQGAVILQIREDWRIAGATFKAGSVLGISLKDAERDPVHLKPTVIFAPTASEFAQSVSTTKARLLLTTLENVQGRAYIYAQTSPGAWTRQRLAVPDNQTVSVETTDDTSNRFFLTMAGFLSPTKLLLGDAAVGGLAQVKALPSQFDTSGLVVDQLWAKSKDGTRIPYFVVHRRNMPYNGTHPTLLTAYGGFEVSMTPFYSGVDGRLWLDRGGVYVLANIRGGGEFGPAWHEAGLTTHRQRIYDDFAAVGQDLIARRITSPARLGIEGGSNGGLLMGVEMTQHPELWKAVVIEVPLLDMLRYQKIAAGSSWVGEYGSVSVPAQRAFLASISPYNQLNPKTTYPQPLIFTTTRDDRVGPVHARKFAARMEEFGKPYYYEEIIEGGHNVGANLKEAASTEALIYTYLVRKLTE